MGLFDKFPYTNFHELNLDWIIGKIKTVETSKDEAVASAAAAKQSEDNAAASDQRAADGQSAAAGSASAAADSAAGIEAAREQIYLNTQRLNNLIVDGQQTAGNTELLDIRVGYDGTIYDTAGNAVRDQVSDLNQALSVNAEVNHNAITAIEIENYTKDFEEVSGTKTEGKVILATGEELSLSTWQYLLCDCEENTGYLIAGTNSTGVRLFVVFDENNNVIDLYPASPGGNQRIADLYYVTPANAAKIAVNSERGYPNYLKKAIPEFKQIIASEYLVNLLDSMEIENYIKSDGVSVEGVRTDDVICYGDNGVLTPISGWFVTTFPVQEYMKYECSGSVSTSAALWYCFDENNVLLSKGVYSTTTESKTETIITPKDASKVIINSLNNGSASLTEKSLIYISESGAKIGVEISPNIWEIGTNKMKTIVSLFGSQNGAVNFSSLKYNNADFKGVSDDITPLNFSGAGYVGANHGYYFGYKATLENHGLSLADIGKTCIIEGNTWVLIKVDSSSQFTVICQDVSTWYGLKTVATIPTTFNFGSSITVTSIEQIQIYPSVKNVDISVIENSATAFIISETYDVINPKNGISSLINNVGNNDNNSLVNLSGTAVTVRNAYAFDSYANCVISQNIKMVDSTANLNFYGGTQSGAFGTSDYYAVPMTDKETMQASGSQADFTRSTWNDSAKPPIIYLQMNNTDSVADKMMLQGIIMDGRNAKITDSAGFIYTSRKMYPYAIEPQSDFQSGETFNLTSFRMPMYKNDFSQNALFSGACKVGRDYYFFAYNSASGDKSIKAPSYLVGKEIETVTAKNAECINSIVSTVLDINFSGAGYILLKLV